MVCLGEKYVDTYRDSLLRRIDKALYEAKEKGRNQVKIAQSSGFC